MRYRTFRTGFPWYLGISGAICTHCSWISNGSQAGMGSPAMGIIREIHGLHQAEFLPLSTRLELMQPA
jgi:hypothetical protein